MACSNRLKASCSAAPSSKLSKLAHSARSWSSEAELPDDDAAEDDDGRAAPALEAGSL